MPIYAKVNATMPWNDKVADLSDGQFRAYVKAICAAKQRENPEFSRRTLKDMLGDHSRHIRSLVRAGLLDELVGGRIAVHDFDEHQSPQRYDPTNARRQADFRARKRAEAESSPQVDNGGDNGDGDVTLTSRRNGARAVHSRTGSSTDRKPSVPRAPEAIHDDVPDDEVQVDPDHPYVVYRAVTGWDASPKQQGVIDVMVRDHTRELLVRAMRAVGRPDRGDDFFGQVRAWITTYVIERDARRVRAQAEADAKAIQEQHELEDRLRAEGMTDEDAAAHRAAIASFTRNLGGAGRES